MSFVVNALYISTNTTPSIIQDCEDALTNWVESGAAVSSKLSTRARQLSQRRGKVSQSNDISHHHESQGLDLSGQDTTGRESGLWVPASQLTAGERYDDDEENFEEENLESRGREEERIAA